MTPEQYRNDMLYHAGLSIAQAMLEQGLITEAELVQIDEKLLAEFRPYLVVYCQKTLAIFRTLSDIWACQKGGIS